MSAWTLRPESIGGGYFVDGASNGSVAALLAANGTVATTTDGVTFTPRTTGLGATGARYIRYFPDAGLFVAATTVGTLATSPSATAWTSRVAGSPGIRSICGAAGKYLLGGVAGDIRVSDDLMTWRPPASKPAELTGNIVGADYIEGRFVLVDANGVLAESADAEHFTLITSRFPFDQIAKVIGRY